MEKKYDIVSVGEILIDMTEVGRNELGNPIFAANPGGAPANVAVAASKLGAKTAFIGKTGDDPLGAGLHKVLTENGVDTRGLLTDTVPTTIALVTVDEQGERDFTFLRSPGADMMLTSAELDRELIDSTRFLHFGSVSLTEEPQRSATLTAVNFAREKGLLVSFDPNYRAPLWKSEEAAVNEIKAVLPLCDILKVSNEEMQLLTGTANMSQASAQLAETGAFLVLVTLGADGVFYRMGGHTGHVPSRPVVVADTNGAGDTFLGALLSRLAQLENPRAVEPAMLEEMLLFANTAAGLTTSRPGAIPAMPTSAEVEAALA